MYVEYRMFTALYHLVFFFDRAERGKRIAREQNWTSARNEAVPLWAVYVDITKLEMSSIPYRPTTHARSRDFFLERISRATAAEENIEENIENISSPDYIL